MDLASRKSPLSWLQYTVHLGAWLPLFWLAVAYGSENLTVNPIQALTQWLGRLALIFLLLSLACTPANSLFGWRKALTVRRTLGLYSFMFVALHFLVFTGLDFGFDLSLLKFELLEKRYIWMGTATGIILLLLAVTSFQWWMKRLGKNWKRLHRFVYLAAVLVVVHYGWALKGDLFRLQGNVTLPLLTGLIVLLLLAVRLPLVRAGILRLRQPGARTTHVN